MAAKTQADSSPRKGLILKQAREAKGLSLQVVHEATKVPMDALKAIEEGYTIRTLSSFYYKGFLKIYARYLGVDISQVVEDYHPEQLPPHISDKKEALPQKFQLPVVSPEVKDLVIKGLIGLIVLLVFVKIVGAITHRKPGKTHQPNVIVQQTQKRTLPKPVAAEPQKELPKLQKEAMPSASVVAPASTVEAAKKIDLAVRARKDSWVQVNVDNQIVFRSILKKGSVETWSAKKNIEISGKDIGELEFELNGKIIGSLSKENRKAKKIVIDQNGFSAK